MEADYNSRTCWYYAHIMKKQQCVKCVHIWSFFWSAFSSIQTKYSDLWSKSPYSLRIQEKNPYLDIFHAVLVSLVKESAGIFKQKKDKLRATDRKTQKNMTMNRMYHPKKVFKVSLALQNVSKTEERNLSLYLSWRGFPWTWKARVKNEDPYKGRNSQKLRRKDTSSPILNRTRGSQKQRDMEWIKIDHLRKITGNLIFSWQE